LFEEFRVGNPAALTSFPIQI